LSPGLAPPLPRAAITRPCRAPPHANGQRPAGRRSWQTSPSSISKIHPRKAIGEKGGKPVAHMWLICTALAIIGCAYTVLAAHCVRAWSTTAPQQPDAYPSVSILKPLSGAEPRLLENLNSFVRQRYPGRLEI